MKLICPSVKPVFPLDSTYCDFRSSKAYLWGLVSDRLNSLQQSSSSSLFCLDAACHALISRHIFPPNCKYYGVDISLSRLTLALKKKLSTDILLRADLTAPISISNCFDVVVSCNTLSHLPSDQQSSALSTLVSLVKPSGCLFVNAAVDVDMMSHCSFLLKHFTKVEVIYFDSYLSSQHEASELVSSNNISKMILTNEFSIPNFACLHQQVVFLCYGSVSINTAPIPDFSSSKITALTKVPDIKSYSFDDDVSLVKYFASNFSPLPHFLISEKLFMHASSSEIFSLLTDIGFQYSVLAPNVVLKSSFVVFLGLENEWCHDISTERLIVNSIRSKPGLSFAFATVTTRLGSKCTPSFLVSDY